MTDLAELLKIDGLRIGTANITFANGKIIFSGTNPRAHLTIHLGENSKVFDLHLTTDYKGEKQHKRLFCISHYQAKKMVIKIKQFLIANVHHLYKQVSEKVFSSEGYYYVPLDPQLGENAVNEMFPIERRKKKSKIRISPDNMLSTLYGRLGGIEHWVLDGNEVMKSNSSQFLIYKEDNFQEVGVVFRFNAQGNLSQNPNNGPWVFMPNPSRDKLLAGFKDIMFSFIREGLQVRSELLTRYFTLILKKELSSLNNINLEAIVNPIQNELNAPTNLD